MRYRIVEPNPISTIPRGVIALIVEAPPPPPVALFPFARANVSFLFLGNEVFLTPSADVNKRRIRRVYAQDFARNRVQVHVDLIAPRVRRSCARLGDRFFDRRSLRWKEYVFKGPFPSRSGRLSRAEERPSRLRKSGFSLADRASRIGFS